jgi:hypothetical protein
LLFCCCLFFSVFRRFELNECHATT